MHYLCRSVLTTPSSAARFRIQAFLLRGKLCLEPSRFHSPTTPLKPETPAALTNTMDVEGTYKGGPQESGTVGCETMIECHVALDVHVIRSNSVKVE